MQGKRQQDFGKGALLNPHQLTAIQEGNFLLNTSREKILTAEPEMPKSVQAIGATCTTQQ